MSCSEAQSSSATQQSASDNKAGLADLRTRLGGKGVLSPKNSELRRARGSSHKRDHSAANSADSEKEEGTTTHLSKKPTAGFKIQAEREGDAKTLIDIDSKHALDPQYATEFVDHKLSFARYCENVFLPVGKGLNPCKTYLDWQDHRLKSINSIYNYNIRVSRVDNQIPTDTIHFAIYIADRLLEHYKRPKDYSVEHIFAAALFLATKFEDIDPTPIETIVGRIFTEIKEMDVLNSEPTFRQILPVLSGPTITAFAHRFLQAVDLECNRAATHTARYFCAIGSFSLELTKHQFSKIAAAAVYIAYHKYKASCKEQDPILDYPEALRQHSDYSLDEIKEVILKLVDIAKSVERICIMPGRPGSFKRYKNSEPVDIYFYYQKAGVVATATIPDFVEYFKTIPEEGSCDAGKTSEDDTVSTSGSHDQNNPESE